MQQAVHDKARIETLLKIEMAARSALACQPDQDERVPELNAAQRLFSEWADQILQSRLVRQTLGARRQAA